MKVVRATIASGIAALLLSNGSAEGAAGGQKPNGASGFVAGLNLSGVSGRYDAWSGGSQSPILGGRFGITMRIPQDGVVAIDTGLLFDRKGLKLGDSRYTFTYLTVPVTLDVPLYRHGRFAPSVNAGFEASILTGGEGEADIDVYDFSAVIGGEIALSEQGSIPFIEVAYVDGLRDVLKPALPPPGIPLYSQVSTESHTPALRNRSIVCVIGIRHFPSPPHAGSPGDFERIRVMPRVGVEAGLNSASVNGGYTSYPGGHASDPRKLVSGRFGIRLDVPQGRIVSLMTGLYFDRRGSEWTDYWSERLTLDYLSIPLCAVIRVPSAGPRFRRLFVRAGPEIGYLLRAGLGRLDVDPFQNNVESSVDGFDLGLSFGGGFDFPIAPAGSTGFIEMGYLYGLRDTYIREPNCPEQGPIAPGGAYGCETSIRSSKDRVLRLSAGFCF